MAALVKLAEWQVVAAATENSGWITAHKWEQSELKLADGDRHSIPS